MANLLDYLEAFNRKERFFVFTYATGNAGLTLSPTFRAALGVAAGTPIPPEAKAYIDYHLDWLHAAVELATNPDEGPYRDNIFDETLLGAERYRVSTGNQEDIDLVVAFESGGITWLILVEAKAETGWTNGQVRSKAHRLTRIFGTADIAPSAVIRPVFCLMSPRPPRRLAPPPGKSWPAWMPVPNDNLAGPSGQPEAFRWLPLPVPASRKKVTGCDRDGKPSALRAFWKVEDVRGAEAVIE